MSEHATGYTGQQLIVKYRPEKFRDVIGHQDILAALDRSLKSPAHPHSYLLTGKSGVGKTTIARIIAAAIGADVLEIDAASNSGVDAMRELVELGFHMPLMGGSKRMIIIDECHTLSRSAFQAVLKITEEPPPHLYFALCTTEDEKVPETVKTRCYSIPLRPVPRKELEKLVDLVLEVEEWNLKASVRSIVLEECQGSPRMLLNLLQAVNGAEDEAEVNRIIQLETKIKEPMIELARLLLAGRAPWKQVQLILSSIDDDRIEAGMIHMGRYLMGAMQRAKNEKEAKVIWQFLDALVFPSQTWDKRLLFFTAVGRMMWVTQDS
jgi:replication-associated recombination protein RarA